MNYTDEIQSQMLIDAGVGIETADITYFPALNKALLEEPLNNKSKDCVPCWSVGQLLEMLPRSIYREGIIEDDDDEWEFHIEIYENGYEVFYRSAYSDEMIDFTQFVDEQLINALVQLVIVLKQMNML